MTVTTKITATTASAAAANTSGIWDGIKSGKKNPFESFHTLCEEENVWPRRGKPEKFRKGVREREGTGFVCRQLHEIQMVCNASRQM